MEKIFNYLNDIFLGPYFFQAALMFRSSLLLNSILVNSESWYNVTQDDVKQLEFVEKIFQKNFLIKGIEFTDMTQ